MRNLGNVTQDKEANEPSISVRCGAMHLPAACRGRGGWDDRGCTDGAPGNTLKMGEECIGKTK